MVIDLSLQAFLAALVIFGLRICDMALDTVRLLFVVRGRRLLAWFLGFAQSAIFIVAISSVLSNANSLLNVLGYAGGFATGVVIGMLIEEKLAIGHLQFKIVSTRLGSALSEHLRQNGFGVTEVTAHGRDGAVSMLHVNTVRKDMALLEKLVREADPEAFITYEDVRPLRRGFWRA